MADWLTTFPGYSQFLTASKKLFGNIIRAGPTPKHVGIIMDGNRRYARNHKIELKEGHNMGFESMASILELLYESGIECATVFAFSIENFRRSKYEVKWLMDLSKRKFKQISQRGELCEQYGVKVKILGNVSLLPEDVQEILRETEEITKNNSRAVLNVCFPYTSRDEMTASIKRIVNESGKKRRDIPNERSIDEHLYTSGSPPLDLLVRTSGTYRLSDFLLWQSVSPGCSIVFVDKLWPEFSTLDMGKILINWGFNTYWYGSGNGPSTVSMKRMLPSLQIVDPSMEGIGSAFDLGVARFEGDSEYYEDDEYDAESAMGSDEVDTVISEEELDPYNK